MFTRYSANWIYIVLPRNNTPTFNQLKLGTTILHKVTVGANYTEIRNAEMELDIQTVTATTL